VFATLAIIVLIPRSHAACIVALHRFFEVSVGILVALALAAVWPERTTRIRQKRTLDNLRVLFARALRLKTNSRSRSV